MEKDIEDLIMEHSEEERKQWSIDVDRVLKAASILREMGDNPTKEALAEFRKVMDGECKETN